MILKVVSHCDLNVLSMSVMPFPKKVWIGGGGGRGQGQLYSVLFWIFLNFVKSLSQVAGMN